MADHGVVTREAMTSEFDGTKRKSFKYLPSGTATAVDNGNVVLRSTLISGEREVYTAGTPAANSALKNILLVTTPEVMVDERLKNLSDFYNAAGDIATGDVLTSGDIFSITSDAFTAAATVAVGDVVELAASTKLKIVASATGLTSGSTQVGTVIDISNSKVAIQVI
jgi:hypothetical protein